jgi:Fe-S-cluster containining protein
LVDPNFCCLANDDKYSIKTLCSSCTHQSCCTGYESPTVLPEDVSVLKQIGKDTTEFLTDVTIEGLKIKKIRKNSSQQCIFWNGKCEIYDFRPLDCRLFPFDIDYIDGEYYWIVYSCNKDSDWKWTEEHLQRFERDPMLHKRIDYLEILCEGPYPDPEKIPYVVLRKVMFADIQE